MELLQAIILGIVQGITEWFPISSEGVNSLIMINFFNKTLTEAIYQSIWLHLGTTLAAIVYFRKTIVELLKNLKNYKINKSEHDKLTTFLIVSTIISGVVGATILLFGLEKFNIPYIYAMVLIGIALLISGIFQLLSKNNSSDKEIETKDSLVIGLLQGFSALPGISRSGITMGGLLLKKFSAEQTLKLSFLMSIPLVLGAEIGIGLLDKIIFSFNSLVAIIISFIVGLITIKYFMKVAIKINFGWFCIIIGLISIGSVLI